MNTKLLDIDDVRRKERRGRVQAGTVDALIARAKRIEFPRGEPAYAVDRDWWHEQTSAHPQRRLRTRRRRRRRITIPGPGTTLAWLIRLVTLGLVRPCTGCRSRARRLDHLGWRGMFCGALGPLGIVDKRRDTLRH